MNPIVENLTGMNVLTDPVIATDLLMAAKQGVKLYAFGLTESATPEVRETLRRHLDQQIEMHEEITAYMMGNGLYHPYNFQEQIRVDLTASQAAVNIG